MDMSPRPGREHDWLQQLVGEWTFESDCIAGPDQPRIKSAGRERVRSLGGLWTIGEGEGEMPGTNEFHRSVMTLGFDPAKGRFVGSFIASMMTTLWLYEGDLDESGTKLVLEAEGPAMTGSGEALYRDVIEVVGPDHKRMISYLQAEDGGWTEFMTANYARVA